MHNLRIVLVKLDMMRKLQVMGWMIECIITIYADSSSGIDDPDSLFVY